MEQDISQPIISYYAIALSSGHPSRLTQLQISHLSSLAKLCELKPTAWIMCWSTCICLPKNTSHCVETLLWWPWGHYNPFQSRTNEDSIKHVANCSVQVQAPTNAGDIQYVQAGRRSSPYVHQQTSAPDRRCEKWACQVRGRICRVIDLAQQEWRIIIEINYSNSPAHHSVRKWSLAYF